MHESARLPRLLAALSLTLPLLSAAQAPAMTDAERARRDAEKVLSFIKFQTVKSKPAAEPGDKPRKPATPSPQRSAATTRPPDTAAMAEATVAAPAQALAGAKALPTAAVATAPVSEQAAASFGTPATLAPPAAPTAVATAEVEAEPDTDDRDEVALQIQRFVEPVLARSAQATLAGGSRKVTVRFTVEPDGTVSKAEAAADAPRRLAKPATDAILQWQFAPLAHARTVDVEIAFRRE
jgi:outer membrane biosynthesis protein TonB